MTKRFFPGRKTTNERHQRRAGEALWEKVQFSPGCTRTESVLLAWSLLPAIDNLVRLIDFGRLQHGRRFFAGCFGCGHSRSRREAVPDVSLVVVLRYTTPVGVHVSELELSCGVALVSGLAVPARGSYIVRREAVAGRIHVAEPDLRPGVAGIGEGFVDLAGAVVITPHLRACG